MCVTDKWGKIDRHQAELTEITARRGRSSMNEGGCMGLQLDLTAAARAGLR